MPCGDAHCCVGRACLSVQVNAHMPGSPVPDRAAESRTRTQLSSDI
jgi:hypothetical protein